MSDNEKTEIRLTLWNELMAKHEMMPYFIRNKLAALMVSIARYDWPHLYPDFFDNIVEVINLSLNVLLRVGNETACHFVLV